MGRRRRIVSIALTLLAVGACRLPAEPVAPPRKSSAPKVKVSTTPSASPQASGSPSASATPTPTPSPSASPSASPSVAPTPTITLSGTIRLDAGYLVAQGAGQIVSNNGSNLLESAAGNLILVGGQILSNNAGSYRVQQALTVPVGTVLPVRGLLVVPVSLTSGEPLGVPVLTTAQGGYQVALPAAEENNVLIQAAVPGTSATDARLKDPRLAFGRVTPPTAGSESAIDDDQALVTTYLRACFDSRVELAMFSDDQDAVIAKLTGVTTVPETLKAVFVNVVQKVRQVTVETHGTSLDSANRKRLAQRVADTILAHTDLAAIMLGGPGSPWTGPSGPAVPAMATVLGQLREASATKLKAKADFFDAQPYLTAANATRPAEQAIKLAYPTDVGHFVVTEYLVPDDPQGLIKAIEVMESVGLATGAKTDDTPANRLRAAYYAIVFALAQTLAAETEPALATIRAYPPR